MILWLTESDDQLIPVNVLFVLVACECVFAGLMPIIKIFKHFAVFSNTFDV